MSTVHRIRTKIVRTKIIRTKIICTKIVRTNDSMYVAGTTHKLALCPVSSAECENLVKYVQNPSKNPKNEFYVSSTVFISDGYRHAFSEKPMVDASAHSKQPMADGTVDGRTCT